MHRGRDERGGGEHERDDRRQIGQAEAGECDRDEQPGHPRATGLEPHERHRGNDQRPDRDHDQGRLVPADERDRRGNRHE